MWQHDKVFSILADILERSGGLGGPKFVNFFSVGEQIVARVEGSGMFGTSRNWQMQADF
jgi:hypothetical protein